MSIIGLEEEGLADSQCLIADMPEVLERVRAVAEEIKSGSLEIPDPMFAN